MTHEQPVTDNPDFTRNDALYQALRYVQERKDGQVFAPDEVVGIAEMFHKFLAGGTS